MEFEDIIYVLVVLVAVGTGILKRINNSFAKAAKQRPAQPKPMEEPADTWEEPLQQMATESFPEVKFVFTETPADAAATVVEQPVVNQNSMPESERPHSSVATEPLADEALPPLIDFTDMDEVKKAVVAHEILQRKY